MVVHSHVLGEAMDLEVGPHVGADEEAMMDNVGACTMRHHRTDLPRVSGTHKRFTTQETAGYIHQGSQRTIHGTHVQVVGIGQLVPYETFGDT